MQTLNVIQRLAATKSRVEKEQIIFDAYMNGCHEFFEGAQLALHPLKTFGIKKVAEIVEDDGSPGDYTFAEFRTLAHRLQIRQLTGNAARDAIHAAADRCHVLTWNLFYRRILLKDLNVGVEEKTINKVINKLVPTHPEAHRFLIPIFKCQLAEDAEKHPKKMQGRKLVDIKLDGVRALAMMDKEADMVGLFTRTGQPIETMPEVSATLQGVLAKLPGSVMLDGELVSPRGFQHLMTLLQRKDGHPDTALIRYALFDVIPLADFHTGFCKSPQDQRRIALESMHYAGYLGDDHRVYLVPQVEVDLDTAEGQAAFVEFNRLVIADGGEGIMLKAPGAPYTGKRTTAWLKKKPVIELTMQIIGVEPGEPDGKYAGTLGALVCRTIETGTKIVSNVAGGISDAMRHELWKQHDALLGMLVEVIADKITVDATSGVHSLRFARLKGFRGRTPGEKL